MWDEDAGIGGRGTENFLLVLVVLKRFYLVHDRLISIQKALTFIYLRTNKIRNAMYPLLSPDTAPALPHEGVLIPDGIDIMNKSGQ